MNVIRIRPRTTGSDSLLLGILSALFMFSVASAAVRAGTFARAGSAGVRVQDDKKGDKKGEEKKKGDDKKDSAKKKDGKKSDKKSDKNGEKKAKKSADKSSDKKAGKDREKKDGDQSARKGNDKKSKKKTPKAKSGDRKKTSRDKAGRRSVKSGKSSPKSKTKRSATKLKRPVRPSPKRAKTLENHNRTGRSASDSKRTQGADKGGDDGEDPPGAKKPRAGGETEIDPKVLESAHDFIERSRAAVKDAERKGSASKPPRRGKRGLGTAKPSMPDKDARGSAEPADEDPDAEAGEDPGGDSDDTPEGEGDDEDDGSEGDNGKGSNGLADEWIEILKVESDKLAEDKLYSISIRNGTYKDLLEGFSHKTGLSYIGELPKGKVDFVTTEQLTYDEAFRQIRKLLFDSSQLEPYWMVRAGNVFEIIPINDVPRNLPKDQMYRSVEDYLAAGVDDDELALVLYTPTAGSISDLDDVRVYLPDYVRISQYGDENKLTIFALAGDINKWLWMIDFFKGTKSDPRICKVIDVQNISPSEAWSKISSLIDGGSTGKLRIGAKSTRKVGGGADLLRIKPPETVVLAVDERGVLLVHAMPDKIAEIERFLPFVDVELAGPSPRTIIELAHADPVRIVADIQMVLAAEGSGSPPPKRAAKPKGRAKGKKRSTIKSSIPVSADEVTLIPLLAQRAIMVIAEEAGVERVRDLVAIFDVDRRFDPVRIDLEYISAQDAMGLILSLLGARNGGEGAADVQLIPDASDEVLWVIGRPRDVEDVRDILAYIDVPQGGTISLHIQKLEYAKPSFVAQMLHEYDMGKSSTKKTLPKSVSRPKGKKSARAKKSAKALKPARITADDENMKLFVYCSDEEWSEYLPLIQQLDDEFKDREESVLRRLAVTHIDPGVAVESLTSVFDFLAPGSAKKGRPAAPGMVQCLPSADDILVVGATAEQFEEMQAFLKEIDRPSTIIDRQFELQYADPADIIAGIEALFGKGGRTIRRTGKGADKKVRSISQGDDGMKLFSFGQILYVSATPKTMEDIATFIAERDVPDEEPVHRLYGDFPEGADVIAIADDLRTLLGVTARPKRPSTGGKTGTSTAKGDVTIIPQPDANRIIVKATPKVHEEVEGYLDMLRDNVSTLPISEVVTLANVDADAIVSSVSSLMTGGATRKKPPRSAGKPGGSTATSGEFTIVAMSSGDAVLLHGPKKDVEIAKGHIALLDQPSGQTIKVYDVAYADLDALAEFIMSTVDTPAKTGSGSNRRQQNQRGRKNTTETIDDDDPFTTTKVHKGATIYLRTDELAGTMLASAPAAKIAQIDGIVEMFSGEGSDFGIAPPLPMRVIKLYHVDAYEAALDLEMWLEVYWSPSNLLPKIDLPPLGVDDAIIVKYPDESRFDEIEKLVRDYIDIESEEATTVVKRTFQALPGLTPEQAIMMIKANNPDLDIEFINVGQKIDLEKEGIIERVRPPKKRTNGCVLPLGFAREASALLGAVLALQDDPDPDDDPEQERDVPQDEEVAEVIDPDVVLQQMIDSAMAGQPIVPPTTTPPAAAGDATGRASAKGKVTIYFDDKTGVFVVEGLPKVVDEVEDAYDDIKELMAKNPLPPDIRIVRIHHIDVNTAARLLDEVFNATSRNRQLQQQMLRAQQQRQRQQQQAQQKAQANRQRGALGQTQLGRGMSGAAGRGVQPPQPITIPGAGAGSVQIVADPRNRTLILKANPGDYPLIYEVLATIDQPQPMTAEYRTYIVENLDAAEVETVLKDMLGLTTSGRSRSTSGATSRQAGRGAAGRTAGRTSRSSSASVSRPLPQGITQNTESGELGVFQDDIKIWSNPLANTILAMAPTAALDYIGELIEQIDAYDGPERITKHFTLEHADAEAVVEYIAAKFTETDGAARRGGKGRRGGESAAATAGAGPRAPSLLPYPPLRMITVQATEEDMAEIEELIAMVDVPGSEKFETVTLANSDANAVAGTLEQMFAGASRGRGRGGVVQGTTGPRFIGEDGGNVLFFSAPLGMHDDIRSAIKTIEESGQEATTPRPIILEYATPTDVASAIQEAYGSGGGSRGGRRGGRSGRTNARFTISGHDASKRLFVLTSDDTTFDEIESLAKSLDKPAEMGFEMRIIPFKHASARAVHEMLTKLVKDYLGRIRGSGGSVEPFAAEVDEKTNSMIILGSPTVFEFVQNAVAVVDIPENAPPKPGYLMIALQNADAQEVANNINNVWGKKKARAGEEPPHAEANRQLNILFVRGTEAQVSEIKTQFIDPLEEHKPPELLTETVTLEYAQAELVAESIQRIFEDKKRAFDAIKGRGFKVSPVEVTVVVTPDVNTNQVIIQASEKNMALAKARIVELDREDIAANTATRMEVYRVKYADPNSVASIINQWAQARTQAGGRGGARRVAARDTVKAIAEPATQSVIVNASNSNHELVAQLLAELDDETFAKSRSRHVLTLKHASANDLANQFRAVFQQRGGRRRGDSGPAFVASPSLNAIVANVNDEELVEITELLAVLDAEPGLDSERTVEVYSLRYADPGSINGVIMNMFRGDRRSQGSPAEQVTSAVDWGTRSVIVTASAKNHLVIARLIEKTDIESTVAKRNHFVELKFANAQDVANAVNNVVRARRRTGRGEAPVNVTPEMATNSLIIYASDEEMEDLRDLIEKIDVEPGIDTKRTMVAYSLKYADPNAIVNAINQTFRGGGRQTRARPEEQVNAVNEWSTQSVIVTASAKNHEKIKQLIAEVDIEGPFKKETHLVPLNNANAQDIANTLTQVVRNRRRGRRGEQAITIVPDVGTNALVVFASQSEMDDIQPLIDSLDVKPDAALQRQVRSFSLKYAHPGSAQQAITSLFRTTGRANPRDQVSAVPEWGGNGVIVSASPENMAKVADLIEQLDQRGDHRGEVHVIQIEFADPAEVAQILDDMYVRTQPRGRGQQEAPVTITAMPGSKAILVKAGGTDLEQIMSTIMKIDTEEVGGGGEIRVVTLLYSDAEEILTAIQEYLRKPNAASSRGGRGRRGGRRGGGSGGGLLGDVRLSLLTQSNSIVVSGDKERVEDVEAQIIDMDEANKDFAKPKFILLTHAKAAQIVPMVEQVMSGTSSSTRRGGRSGRRGAAQGFTVMAHDRLNALIVRGGPADIATVEAIVEGLDVPDAKPESTIKVIQVSAALNVTDLAITVEGVVNDGQAALEDKYPGMSVGRITVSPDRRGSAIIIAGDPALFSAAEELIRTLEITGPKGGVEVGTSKPPAGMTAEEWKALLEQLTNSGGGTGARRGSAGASRNSSRRRTGGGRSNRSSSNRGRRP